MKTPRIISAMFAMLIGFALTGAAQAQSTNDYRYNQEQTIHSQQYVGTPHQIWCGPAQPGCVPMGPSANPGARTQYSGNDQTSGTPPQLVVDPSARQMREEHRWERFNANHPNAFTPWQERHVSHMIMRQRNGDPVAYPGTTTMQPMYAGNNQMQQGMATQAQPMRVRGQRQR